MLERERRHSVNKKVLLSNRGSDTDVSNKSTLPPISKVRNATPREPQNTREHTRTDNPAIRFIDLGHKVMSELSDMNRQLLNKYHTSLYPALRGAKMVQNKDGSTHQKRAYGRSRNNDSLDLLIQKVKAETEKRTKKVVDDINSRSGTGNDIEPAHVRLNPILLPIPERILSSNFKKSKQRQYKILSEDKIYRRRDVADTFDMNVDMDCLTVRDFPLPSDFDISTNQNVLNKSDLNLISFNSETYKSQTNEPDDCCDSGYSDVTSSRREQRPNTISERKYDELTRKIPHYMMMNDTSSLGDASQALGYVDRNRKLADSERAQSSTDTTIDSRYTELLSSLHDYSTRTRFNDIS